MLSRLVSRPVTSTFSRSLVIAPLTRLSVVAQQNRIHIQTTNNIASWTKLQTQIRYASTSTNNANNKTDSDTNTNTNSNSSADSSADLGRKVSIGEMWGRLREIAPRLKTYGVLAGVGFGVLMVFKGGLGLVEFFGSLNFADVGEVAFVAGMVTAWGLSAVAWVASRSLRLRPEPVYQHAVRRIINDQQLKAKLGQDLKPAAFRAYSFVPGSIRWFPEARTTVPTNFIDRVWKPKRLQLFFQVDGSQGKAMVSAEVEKDWHGAHHYNLLSLDILSSGERIVLEGDENYKIYQGVIQLR